MAGKSKGWTIDETIARHLLPATRNGCELWNGAKTEKGYGKVGYRGKAFTVSRVVLARKLGRPIKPGHYALHECDNTSCCAEAHLFEGTQRDNQQDMARKGRSLRGERHNMAKLTEKKVRRIRELCRTTSKYKIAAMYGVSYATIWLIDRRASWKHVV